jgi:hypothetical protein
MSNLAVQCGDLPMSIGIREWFFLGVKKPSPFVARLPLRGSTAKPDLPELSWLFQFYSIACKKFSYCFLKHAQYA